MDFIHWLQYAIGLFLFNGFNLSTEGSPFLVIL